MTTLMEVARTYIQERYPDVRGSFFDRAWALLSDRFAAVPAGDVDFASIEQPLGMAGRSKASPVKTIVVFVAADQWMKAGAEGDELLSAVRELADRYDQNERTTREILDLLRSSLCEQRDSASTSVAAQGQSYRVWCKDSEPEGENIDAQMKDAILKRRKPLPLVVVDEQTSANVYVHGARHEAPSPDLFRVLSFLLKHKGTGGTSLYIAQNVFSIDDNWGFRSLDSLLEAIRLQPELYKHRQADLNDELVPIRDDLRRVQGNIRKRIDDLRNYFEKICLGVNIRAVGPLKQYQLDPLLDYRLIERKAWK